MPQGTEVGTVNYTNCISTFKPLKDESTADPVLHAVSCSVDEMLSSNIKPSFNVKLDNTNLTNIHLTMLKQLLVEYVYRHTYLPLTHMT